MVTWTCLPFSSSATRSPTSNPRWVRNDGPATASPAAAGARPSTITRAYEESSPR